MKLNNRKLHVHDIVLNMRETYSKGTLLEVFGEKRLSSIAISVNIFLTPLCELNHSVFLSSELYLNKQALRKKSIHVSWFYHRIRHFSISFFLSRVPGLHYSRSQLWGIRKQEKDDNINISIKLTVLLAHSK